MPHPDSKPFHGACVTCGPGAHRILLDDLEDRLGRVRGPFRYGQCLRCDLISLCPIPDAKTIADFYPPSFWRTEPESGSPGPLRRLETWYRERLLRADFAMLRPLIGPGVSHLDVGCATGDLIVLAQAHGARSMGIEAGAAAVRHCVEQRHLEVVRGDLPEHDFGSRKFDVITYNAVLEHVSDPSAHLRKCGELLAPGGRVCIIGLPNIESLGFRLTGRRWIGLDCPRHLHQFSRHSLERLLAKTGFRLLAWNTRSPRLNRSVLVGSVFPALHRHAFDEYEKRTGRNPVERKVMLFGLFQLGLPIDWAASAAGLGELMNCIAGAES